MKKEKGTLIDSLSASVLAEDERIIQIYLGIV